MPAKVRGHVAVPDGTALHRGAPARPSFQPVQGAVWVAVQGCTAGCTSAGVVIFTGHRGCKRWRTDRDGIGYPLGGEHALETTQEATVMNSDELPAPREGLLLTHFLTVSDVARSRAFYADIFGGQVVLEENPCIVKVANSWIIMNPGGGPTPDKPDIILR